MGLLDGINVLEVAEQGFVPSAAAILADWGADVVKVERLTGDPLRGYQKAGFVADTGDFNFLWEQFNRNKRGIAIDLRNRAGRDALDPLIAWCDVFITSFLPSARTNLRLQPDDVWAVNARAVYARGHGQGQLGPDADSGGFDAVSYWSRGGIGHMLTPPAGPFIMQRGAMGDAPSGAFLAGGICAALLQRERTGKGCTVDVALLNSACWTLSNDLVPTSILGHDPERPTGKPLSSPLVGPYRTADARWVVLNMLDPDRHWAPACRALGLDELIDHPDYATTALRAAHNVAVHEIFRARIEALPFADVVARLKQEDTIFSPLATPMEVLADPQVEANGYYPRHPEHPHARLAAGPVQIDGEHTVIRRRAPRTGEHTDEVLREVGFSDDALAALRASGALG